MLDYETVRNWPFEPLVQTYTKKDCMLYALGLGFGSDPTDAGELQYVYEKGLKVFPTMAVVLGHPGPWLSNPKTGIDMTRVLHGEQSLEIHRPLPVEGSITASTRILDIIDKGPERGAIILTERRLFDSRSGEHYCTQQAGIFARGDGGCGGPRRALPRPRSLPDREPDGFADIPTSPRAALLYRLSGDYNPLHVDPAVAARAGFEAPILHGLASYGVAARAVLRACAVNDAGRLRSLCLRFSSPVYPGETIRTEVWREGDTVSFRSSVPARDTVVLDNGRAALSA